jgi:uncharacterized protein (DUF2252 family)
MDTIPSAAHHEHPRLVTAADRREAGRAIRHRLPRGAHAVCVAPSGRRDPVTILQESETTRIAPLVPVRYGRMRTDAFAFLRGGAAIMAADLGGMPETGLRVQACGDCHLMNFGAFASPEGTPLFDINDFDETLPAPFEWDLKRLAASLATAGRARGLSDKAATALARRAAKAYRVMIDDLAASAPYDAWRTRIDLVAAIEDIGDRDIRRAQRMRLHHAVEASRDGYKRLVSSDGSLRLPENPPIVYRLGAEEKTAHAAFTNYLDCLAEERRVLVERYRLRDVAFKAVGVGSVGTFCAVGLFATDDDDVLLLQLKEAQRSVLAPYAGDSDYVNQGQRVVVGQRMMQAAPDLFLGWTSDGADGRHFYVRQLKDSRLASVGAHIEGDALAFYARLCGRTLARAHARSGDAAMIAGYLGEGDSFDDAIAAFALAYARQNDSDYEAFMAAIRDGRIEAWDKPK